MATGQGVVTINFGAWPGAHEASVDFADAAVGATTKVEPFVMSSATAGDHTAADHRYLPAFASFTAEPLAGVGGRIYGRSVHKLQGQWAIRYVYAD